MNNCEIYFYVILLNNEKILINNQINENNINKVFKKRCMLHTSYFYLILIIYS